MGYYFRNQHEILMVGTRGNLPPPLPENRPPSVYREKKSPEHSRKPDYYYDMIDRMYPGIRKIELFNRGGLNRPLWTAWGNQAFAQEPEPAVDPEAPASVVVQLPRAHDLGAAAADDPAPPAELESAYGVFAQGDPEQPLYQFAVAA
jgi:hypothetical protein